MMETHKLDDFVKWWFVGDFFPVIHRTSDFEVSIKHYQAGDMEKPHYHAIATEITAVVNGEFVMNGTHLKKDDIMVLQPWEVAEFQCILDGSTVVVKTPSVANDKYLK